MATQYARMLPGQMQRTDVREVQNNAGGFVYGLDDMARLQRFLILGSDSNTYYESAPKLTAGNADCVKRCWDADPAATGQLIVDISHGGRAPKNDAAIFALVLGMLSTNVESRKVAYAAVPHVCRTATHLFQLVKTAKLMKKGFGRGFKRAIAGWYNGKSVDDVGYQMAKYRSREGLTHENVLDMARPHPGTDIARNNLYAWAVGAGRKARNSRHNNRIELADHSRLPGIVQAHVKAMEAANTEELLKIVLANPKLTWEMVPTLARTDPPVFAELLKNMPMHAMVRQLALATRARVLTDRNEATLDVCRKLRDPEAIRKSRLHPMSILMANDAYALGRGTQKSQQDKTWHPIAEINRALSDAFYLAFPNVEPTGKRLLVAIDVSGSMGGAMLSNQATTAREASAALAAVFATTEKDCAFVGFSAGYGSFGHTKLMPLQFTAGMPLGRAKAVVSGIPFGATDCALPMLYALQNGLDFDAFVVITDSETWAGAIKPMEALRSYRQSRVADAKLVVIGMTSTGFTIADPQDRGSLDVVGFDTAAPSLIADFIRGR